MASLKNPQVKDRGHPQPKLSAKDFKTHIPEPRWQQVVTIIVVGGLLVLWIWAGLGAR